MSDLTVIYWRDIPTQIVAGRGRKAIKQQLADRFMVAVDKAAMSDGATNADAYLEDWRKVPRAVSQDDVKSALEQLANQIENDYPASRLAELARQGGKENEKSDL